MDVRVVNEWGNSSIHYSLFIIHYSLFNVNPSSALASFKASLSPLPTFNFRPNDQNHFSGNSW